MSRLHDLLGEALELDAHARAAFLDDLAPAERRELERYLDGEEEAEEFFDELGEAVVAGVGAEIDLVRTLPRFGPYRALEEIGRGGMGRVYRAERDDGQFEQQVAVKVLRRARSTQDLERRFLAERQILAGLQHPRIARLLDGGVTDEGRPYFVMEFVEGQTLTDYCDQQRLGIDERLELFLQACEAVEYAHSRLVVHRDLKPSNVLVGGDGGVKLVDFGIARLVDHSGHELETDRTVADSRAMTPEFAAPEQLVGEAITTATDVYGLGVVLFELLSGHRPFSIGSSLAEFEREVLETPAPLPSTVVPESKAADGSGDDVASRRGSTGERLRRRLSGDLDRICAMALRKEPERRYPSVAALAQDLRRHLSGRPVSARRDSWHYRARKFVGRNRLPLAVGAAFVALLFGALVVLSRQVEATAQERDRAERISDFLLNLFEVADPNESRGREVTASELVEQAARRLDGSLGEQPETRASLLEVLGRVHTNLGLFTEAEPLLEESLEVRLASLGAGHRDVIASRRSLSELRRLRGEHDASLELILAAQREAEDLYGGESVELAELLEREGRVRLELRQFDEAARAFGTALDLNSRLLGESHEAVGEVRNGLAVLALHQGRFGEAERLLVSALETFSSELGEDHPMVPGALNNLATALSRQGRSAEAAEVYRRTLAIYDELFAENHPRTATALNNLGLALYSAGRAEEALEYLERAIAARRSVLTEDHPDVAQSLSNYGLALQQLGRYREAARHHERALAIRIDVFGAEDPRVAQSLNNTGLLARDRGLLAEAQSALVRSLSIMTQRLGEDHPATAVVRSNLGDVKRRRGDPEARRDLETALSASRAALPADHVNLSYPLLALGQMALGEESPERAGTLLDEALELRTLNLGEEHWQTAEVRVELAAAAMAEGRGDVARQLLAASLGPLEAAGPPASLTMRRAEELLRSLSAPQ